MKSKCETMNVADFHKIISKQLQALDGADVDKETIAKAEEIRLQVGMALKIACTIMAYRGHKNNGGDTIEMLETR